MFFLCDRRTADLRIGWPLLNLSDITGHTLGSEPQVRLYGNTADQCLQTGVFVSIVAVDLQTAGACHTWCSTPSPHYILCVYVK